MAEAETLGDRLKRLRNERKLTASELGRKAGVGENAIFKLESGLSKAPSFGVGIKLARALDVDPWEIAYGTPAPRGAYFREDRFQGSIAPEHNGSQKAKEWERAGIFQDELEADNEPISLDERRLRRASEGNSRVMTLAGLPDHLREMDVDLAEAFDQIEGLQRERRERDSGPQLPELLELLVPLLEAFASGTVANNAEPKLVALRAFAERYRDGGM